MKLRIHPGELRLRLSRPEVAEFAAQGRIEDSVRFAPDVRLAYRLETSSNQDRVSVEYHDGQLRILLPEPLAAEWARTERVAIEGRQEQLSILVEKDFQCLHKAPPVRAEVAEYPKP